MNEEDKNRWLIIAFDKDRKVTQVISRDEMNEAIGAKDELVAKGAYKVVIYDHETNAPFFNSLHAYI
ncbi:hypothetical protein [Larkinella arboricola]